MRLTFLGATHEVTGSCYYLEAAGKKFLVDCGMEQGPNIYENKPIPVPASQLDFVLITHAHIDHTGNLPLLYAHGFRGPIYMTPATVALSDIMLRDSAHIQLAEAEWRNRKNRRVFRLLSKNLSYILIAFFITNGLVRNSVSCYLDLVRYI